MRQSLARNAQTVEGGPAGSSDVDAKLLGGSRPCHLRENIEAVAAGPLPDDVVAACAALRGPMPAYHR